MSSATISARPWVSEPIAHQFKLTARGRALLAGLLAIVAALSVTGLLLGAGSRSATLAAKEAALSDRVDGLGGAELAARGLAVQHVVVRGDTLWDLAVGVDPTADPRPMVDRIQYLNGLADSELAIGRSLWIPSQAN